MELRVGTGDQKQQAPNPGRKDQAVLDGMGRLDSWQEKRRPLVAVLLALRGLQS